MTEKGGELLVSIGLEKLVAIFSTRDVSNCLYNTVDSGVSDTDMQKSR